MRDRALLELEAAWRELDEYDVDTSLAELAPRLAGTIILAKRHNATASAAYLADFVALELGEPRGEPVALEDRSTVTAAGVPVLAAVSQLAPAIKWATSTGKSPTEAKSFAFARLATIASSEIVDAGRDALHEAMLADERVAGWQRVVYGTCAACLGRQGESSSAKAEKLRVHPHCRCMTEPVVAGVEPAVKRPTARQLFERMTIAEQDAAFGKQAAEQLRSGSLSLSKLAKVDRAGRLVQRSLTRRGPRATPKPKGAPRRRITRRVESTEELYKVGGEWTLERQQLHAEITEQLLGSHRPQAQRRVYLTGGGPASGKGSFANGSRVPVDAAHVDPDAIKGLLPEYQRAVADGQPWAAAFVHEESSYLSKKIAAEAAQRRLNLVLDTVGDSALESLARKVAATRSEGARVVADYATVPTDLAVERAARRAARTGRFVPDEYIREAHASVSRVLPEAMDAGVFDEVRLWDTSGPPGGSPTLIMESVDGVPTIHRADLWESFLTKGAQT